MHESNLSEGLPRGTPVGFRQSGGGSRSEQDGRACGTQSAGIVNAGQHVVSIEAGVGLDDIFNRVPSTQVAENGIDCDSRAADYRATVADFWIELDSMFHTKRLGTVQETARGKNQRNP